jgi:hypothetical protein
MPDLSDHNLRPSPIRVIGRLDAPGFSPDALLDAGRTLATLAEPGKDLAAFASELAQIALTLKNVSRGIDTATDRADELYEGIVDSRQNHGAARQARDGELDHARSGALRVAKKALVDLARVVAELEAQVAAGEQVA